MVSKILTTKQIKKIQLSNSSITGISYNRNTSIICASAHDGGLILADLDSKDDNYSQILTPLDTIYKIKWLNNYEFIIAGNERFINHFSLMNLKNISYEIKSGYITSLENSNEIIYTGSSDGKIGIWDIRKKTMTSELIHKKLTKPQPIRDFKVMNYTLYSSTLFKGRIWMWDLRNIKKPVNLIETETCQNSLLISKRNLFSACDYGILRTSLNLNISEYFYKERNIELYPQTNIQYMACFDSFFWNRKNIIRCKSNTQEITIEIPDLNGFELVDDDKLIVYSKSGSIALNKIFEKIDW